MKPIRTITLILPVAGSLLASACSEVVTSNPESPSEQRGQQTATPQANQHPQEQPFAEISAKVPEFGGYFLKGDTIIVYITDMNPGPAAQALVRAAVPSHILRGPSGPRSVLARTAEYSFRRLQAWRDRAEQSVFQMPDVVWLDLDEGKNRVVVGLNTGAGRAAVTEQLAKDGVPLQAVGFEVTGPLVLQNTLREYNRPLAGGLLAWRNGFSVDPIDGCTYGFNAVINGSLYITTASHCGSAGTWQRESDLWYQPNTDSVGQETLDPPPDICGTYFCRYSDVAAMSFSGSQNVAFGFLYRTQGFSYDLANGNPNPGSLDIDSSNPRFRIIGEQDYSIQGQLVFKMGQKTGWTSGDVTHTCVDSHDDFYKRLCQDEARYYSEGGDSGAPIFTWPYGDDQIIILGGHVGQEGDDRVYSPLGDMRTDFGSVITYVSVGINGPPLIQTSGTYQWQALPSPSSLGYSYQWWVHYFQSGEVDSLGTAATQDLYVVSPTCGNLELGVRVSTTPGAMATRTSYVNTYTSGCGGGDHPSKAGATGRR